MILEISLILLGLFSVFLFLRVKFLQKKVEEKENLIKNEFKQLKQEKEKQIQEDLKHLNKQVVELNQQKNILEKNINEKTQFNQSLLRIREEELDKVMKEKEEKAFIQMDVELKEEYDLKKQKLDKDFERVQFDYFIEKEKLTKSLEKLSKEVLDYKIRRDTINEEIRREREVLEQQDFYKIYLNEFDKKDIQILRDAAVRLNRPYSVNKIIWSGYYQKPLADLRKRLLPNGDVCGIYKITRIKTNEIYIGQSVSIDKRWQEHFKSALGVGTIANSQLHRVMALDGPENFTFEVLEETPKEKLRERESFYIDFFDSKNYGLNSVRGDRNGD